MIKNETKITKKNVEFITNIYFKESKLIIIYRLFVFLFGLWLVLSTINDSTIYMKLLFLTVGIIAIYFSTIGIKKIFVNNRIKKSKIDIPRIIQIDDKKIDIEMMSKNIQAKNTINFEIIKKYYENDNNIYILLNDSNYIVINNNGYKKGTKEELIKILEKNKIKKGK
ncbi:MAG: hypothetical protein IKF91_03495 [Bacilli bacterium]|nr:hypothetical protein [Bacilli bacterium]